MCMVRSPKSIGGAVGVRLGNAPYKIGDRTCISNYCRLGWRKETQQRVTFGVVGFRFFKWVELFSTQYCFAQPNLRDYETQPTNDKGNVA